MWQQISPDLTEGTEPRAPGFGTITAIGTTTADPNLVYAGTDSGLMWVSRNAMAADPASAVTWTKLTSPVFPGRWVTRITVDQDNPKVAWASFSGWRSGDGYPHLVMTSDGGNTWVDIAGKKHSAGADQRRHPPLAQPKWLFIATDVGVYPHDEPRQDVAQGRRQPAARADQRHRPARRQRHALRGDLRSQRLDDLAGRRLLISAARLARAAGAVAGEAHRRRARGAAHFEGEAPCFSVATSVM